MVVCLHIDRSENDTLSDSHQHPCQQSVFLDIGEHLRQATYKSQDSIKIHVRQHGEENRVGNEVHFTPPKKLRTSHRSPKQADEH